MDIKKYIGLALFILGWAGCASPSLTDPIAPSGICIECRVRFDIAWLKSSVKRGEEGLFQDRERLSELGPNRLQPVSECVVGYDIVRERIMWWSIQDAVASVDLGKAEKAIHTVETRLSDVQALRSATQAVDVAIRSVSISQEAASDVVGAHHGYLACAGEAGEPVRGAASSQYPPDMLPGSGL